MSEPLVTVIMPSLNVKKYIRTCMDSVIGQSLRELEILCIDAGSTDGTLEILEEYVLSDARIKLVHSGVKSYGKQVNMGFDLAKGKYVAVVETDDYIDCRMYEKLYALAEENQLDFVKADFMGFRTLRSGQKCFDEGRVWSGGGPYGKVLSVVDHPELYVRDVNIWKGLYNRHFLMQHAVRLSETPGAAFQDIGFCCLLLLHARRGMYVKDMLYFYRRDNGESSSSKPCGLRYAYQEYKRLCSLPIACENMELFYHHLYVRMAYVFLGEYEKLLRCGMESEGEFREAVGWFQNMLGRAVEEREIAKGDVGEEVWEKLRLLVNREEAFAVEWHKDQKKKDETERSLLDAIGTGRIVIFGCGHYGKKSLLFCDKHNVDIAAFSDNNPDLWGDWECGYEVCKPAELNMKYSDVKILISTPQHEKAIRNQLAGIGIGEERIILFQAAV